MQTKVYSCVPNSSPWALFFWGIFQKKLLNKKKVLFDTLYAYKGLDYY